VVPDRFWGGTSASTIVVGGIGYLFVALMAATSNDASVAWLGARRWKALHTVGAYWLWQVFLLTYALSIPRDSWHVVPVAILLGAWGLRLAARSRRPALVAA
jgi:DMSO/TMAO reductase YedYZ heme-binding membrane subunit